MNTKKLYNKLSITGILLGFALFCYALYFGVYDYNKFTNSVKTKASVVNVDFNGDEYVVAIKYEVMNKSYEKTITKKAESITINDFIDVLSCVDGSFAICAINKNQTNTLFLAKEKSPLYVAENMKAGDIITEQNVRSVRPIFGLHPKYYNECLGKKVNRDLEKGDRMRLEFVL